MHIAFSRMALTDASFLLAWIVAIGLGQRFLERPNLVRAVPLGLSVGVAQLFKYNGGIAGLLIALCAAVRLISSRSERSATRIRATWGWGLLAALIAALVDWPWYRFVESHGGYAGLLAHQRSYLGGLGSWPGHLGIQLAQERDLSGGPAWQVVAGLVAATAMWTARGRPGEGRSLTRTLLQAALLTVLSASGLPGLVFMVLCVGLVRKPEDGVTTAVAPLVIGWILLLALTPCYHPYARLWLPCEAFGWILTAGGYVTLAARSDTIGLPGRRTGADRPLPDPLVAVAAFCILAFLVRNGPEYVSGSNRITTLLGPTDSLRSACRAIARDLPRDVRSVRLYARPPMTFYLAGRLSVLPQPDLRGLFAGESGAWAVLDEAMIRGEKQEGRHPAGSRDAGWVLVREVPSELNLPTLLDIDPTASARGRSDMQAPLSVWRRQRGGAR
jgi:hypothetical protein